MVNTKLYDKMNVYLAGILAMGGIDLWYTLKYIAKPTAIETNPIANVVFNVGGEIGVVVLKVGFTLFGTIMLFLTNQNTASKKAIYFLFMAYGVLMCYWAWVLFNPEYGVYELSGFDGYMPAVSDENVERLIEMKKNGNDEGIREFFENRKK